MRAGSFPCFCAAWVRTSRRVFQIIYAIAEYLRIASRSSLTGHTARILSVDVKRRLKRAGQGEWPKEEERRKRLCMTLAADSEGGRQHIRRAHQRS
jgi:hypothetical protein